MRMRVRRSQHTKVLSQSFSLIFRPIFPRAMKMSRKYKNPKNPKKSRNEQGEEEQWQHQGPCRVLQLQPDLVMEILSRLPFETLFDCRCVCKPWLHQIAQPQFAQLCNSRSQIGILMKNYPPKNISRRLDFAHIEESADSEWRVKKIKFTPKANLPNNGNFELVNSCNGLLCLHGPEEGDSFYVCNPILGEYFTIPQKGPVNVRDSLALGFSIKTDDYKILRFFFALNEPLESNKYEAEIYTIGTGVWRSLGKVPGYPPHRFPFDAYLHGALHWINCSVDVPELINSFNFETEEFRVVPPPSFFGPLDMEFSECLMLGVTGGCLVICVYGNDSSELNMWAMKDYGVQESWTKMLVVETLFPRERSIDLYEPMVFLSNGEIILSYNDCSIVCYIPKTKDLEETKIAPNRDYRTINYSPSFVSLYDIASVEEVKSVGVYKKCVKPYGRNLKHNTTKMPPHKSTKLNSGHRLSTLRAVLPIATTSSVSDFSWRTGTACALCDGDLGYLFRGKGFATCQQCFKPDLS